MYKEKHKGVHFHVEFGSPSLFGRVRYKMRNVTTLYMDGVHFYYDFVKQVNRQLIDEDLVLFAE